MGYRLSVWRDYSKITQQNCVHFMKDKVFDYLYEVAIGSSDNLMILQGGNDASILVYDKKLNLMSKINIDNGYKVYNAAISDDNVIAVSETNNDKVIKYSIKGNQLSTIGSNGSKDGQFLTPRGLTFSDNKLFVVDGDNYRVQVFEQNDKFSFSFGCQGTNPGQFQHPEKIAIDSKANILISDDTANCIHIFSGKGEFIQQIPCNLPRAIAISPAGFLITGHETKINKIKMWSPTYKIINQFGNVGHEQGEFDEISGIAIDSSEVIYMVETMNKRIQIIH